MKKPKLKDGKEQLKSYCNATGAPIGVWTNGKQISYYNRKDPNYFEDISDIPNVNESITLFAKFTPNAYKITYKYDSDEKYQTVLYDRKFSLETPVKIGYEFQGWYDEESHSEIINSVWQIPNDVILVPKWKLISYDINYTCFEGSNNYLNKHTYTIKEEVELFSPTKEGYAFLGWYTSEDFIQKVTKINKNTVGNIKLYAKWAKLDFDYEIIDGYITLTKYKQEYTSISIPSYINNIEVNTIGARCFSNSLVEEVYIPSNVKVISKYGFANCSNLKSIKIDEGVKIIENNAFDCCHNIIKITLPNSINTIGDFAFINCLLLEEITFGDGINKIGNGVLFNCFNINQITYTSTKENWKLVEVIMNWNLWVQTNEIICCDGTITITGGEND